MSNQLNRTYIGADAYMLEKSQELQAQLLLDLADFTAFDSEIDNTFAANWLTAITTAMAYKSDNLVVSEQKGKTDLVEQAMKACSTAYADIIHFAKKAFNNTPAVLGQFGQGAKYHNASKSQAKMVEFMDEFNAVTTTHSAQLQAHGCPLAVINAVTTAFNNLSTLNQQQNLTIDGRPTATEERVQQLNNAYTPMAFVIETAQSVYRGNPTKLGQYRYAPHIHHLPPANTQLFTLQPGNVVNIKFDGLVITPTTTVKITTTGTTIYLYTADTPDAQPQNQYLEIKHDKTTTKTAEQLSALIGNKNFTNLYNPGTHPGTCQIVVRAEVL